VLLACGPRDVQGDLFFMNDRLLTNPGHVFGGVVAYDDLVRRAQRGGLGLVRAGFQA